jgi:hypothetical protein
MVVVTGNGIWLKRVLLPNPNPICDESLSDAEGVAGQGPGRLTRLLV